MRLIIIFSFFIIANKAFGQYHDFNYYDLTEKVIKKNKVKTSIDNNPERPSASTIYEYDRLGRVILWYYKNSDTKQHSKYLTAKDTIIKVDYVTENGIEEKSRIMAKYVFNKKGFITLWAYCIQSYLNNKTEADFKRFYYDQSNKLISVLSYSSMDYPFAVTSSFPVVDTLLTLINVENFTYNKSSQLISIKQMIGKKEERYVYNFFYDKKKRLVKEVKFQKEGHNGMFSQTNIFSTIEYKYTDSSKIETKTEKYTDGLNTTTTKVIWQYETVKQKNGLTDKIYWIKDNKKSLSAKNEYTFY